MDIGDRLKLHRREIRLAGKDYTIISPRPGTQVRFSTNYYHHTWHILSDLHGARMLSRLLWGLSFQRKPGTMIVIDQSYLDPTPFEAEPANPIVLLPSRLTHVNSEVLKHLQHQLPLRTPPTGTVRWQTPGLAEAEIEPLDRKKEQSQIHRTGNLVVFAGTAAVLRDWATYTFELGDWYRGMDYTELPDPSWRENGEVQIFSDYHRRVSAARVARQELLEENGAEPTAEQVWDRGEAVRQRRGYL
jgi:hypothetical protein